jgi:hypothetical protein
MWGKIAYPEKGSMMAYRIGGRVWTADALLALDEQFGPDGGAETRRALADAWVAQSNGADELTQLRDERATFLAQPGNAEYAGYDAWADSARKYGVPAFRAKMMDLSPNYADYINGLPPEITSDPAKFDQASISTRAYLASEGKRASVYDPIPSAASDPSKINAATFVTGGTGGGQTPAKGSTPTDPGVKLQKDLLNYQADLVVFNGVLQAYLGDPTITWDQVTNPIMQEVFRTRIMDQYGVSVPGKPRSLEIYEKWAAAQPAGTKIGLEDYVGWLRSHPEVWAAFGFDSADARATIMSYPDQFSRLNKPIPQTISLQGTSVGR